MSPDAVDRFRRFARAVTLEVGALDTSFLGRGRPLGSARVLTAIGRGCNDVSALREALKLDSALMSRLLRGLEEEGLVATAPDPADARRRIATLTSAGRAEFSSYESLADARARETLARFAHPEKLLDAMDLIATALGGVNIVETDPRSAAARRSLEEYYAELARRFAHGFDVTRSRDPDAAEMIRPRGAFFVALVEGRGIGCVGLKGDEVKRLWVAPPARGLGLARRLLEAVEQAARENGVTTLRLDTNSALPEAAALYRGAGWREIARFNDDPYPDQFFEKRL
jgi:DNA-binding MarR family transcriptional regulator/GNAT superfamily N-acetyltransferase